MEQRNTEQMVEEPMATASPTYSPPDSPAAPLAAGLVEEAMAVLAETLVTIHRVRPMDWPHEPWAYDRRPVLPGLELPWHPPFIQGYGSYMNSLGLDPEMAAELAKQPVVHWGVLGYERRYGLVKRGDLDVVNGDYIQGVEGPHRWRLGLAQTGGYLSR